MGAVDTPLTVLQAKAQAVMSGDLIRSVSVLVNRNLIYRILMYHNLLDRLLVMAALVEAGVTQIRVIQMGVETNNPPNRLASNLDRYWKHWRLGGP